MERLARVDRSLTVADFEALHWRHLRQGALGVADEVRSLAAHRDATVAEVVALAVRAMRSERPELAGWAAVVVPFVQAAVEAGVLALADQPTCQSTRSVGRGE